MESPLFIEIALAVTVVVAVVLIGVLIWIGNEQQRKALEELRTDVRDWALGDLEIKRMKAAREIRILDPMGWLDNMVRKVMGISPRISDVAGVLERPEAVVTITENARYLVFSPVHPDAGRDTHHLSDHIIKPAHWVQDSYLSRGFHPLDF